MKVYHRKCGTKFMNWNQSSINVCSTGASKKPESLSLSIAVLGAARMVRNSLSNATSFVWK